MKKLIQLTVIFLLGSFVFSSCSSNLSITKRRYNKGFFVQHHKGATPADKKSVAKNETKKATAPVNFAPSTLNKEITKNPEVNVLPSVITAEAPKKHRAKAEANKTQAPVTIGSAIAKPIKTFRTASDLVKSAASGDDALSLLWIVIVIILILYLLGLLFGSGTGNAIHLLAVVALVLLILWLLKII